MQNCHSYTITILQSVHAYVFCSYENNGSAPQNYLKYFYFTPWYMHNKIHLESKEKRKGNKGDPIFLSLSFNIIIFK